MRDEDRTKEELVEELLELRSRLSECLSKGEGHLQLEAAGVNCDILLNNVGDLAYVCDDHGNILYVNRVFERLSGHRPSEFFGRSFAPLFSGEDLRVATDNYQRTLEGESPSYEIAFKDTGIVCAYRNVPFRDADGRIIGVLGIARDVTEERRAEIDLEGMRQRLIDSEERYRTLVEQSPDNIIIHSLDGTILFTNASRVDVLGGKTPEDIIGKSAMDFVHPDDREHVGGVIGRLLEDFEAGRFCVQTIEHRFVRLDGSVFQGEATGCPLVYNNELAMQVIVRDVTERKAAERALTESRRKYRSLFENMLVGAAYHEVLFDDDGAPEDIVFLEINKAYEKTTGVRREDVIGKKATEVFPGLRDLKPDIVDVFGRVASAGDEATMEFFFEPLGKWYDVSAFSPKKGFFVATFYDVSERKKAEEELRRSRDDLEERVAERTVEFERLNDVLRESESLYRTLVDNIPYGIQEVDTNGVITFANPAHDRRLGYEHGATKGKRIVDLVASDEERESLQSYFKRLVAEQPPPVPYYGVHRTVDNRLMDVKVDWTYKRNAEGELTGFVSVITDITEQKRADEEIKRNYQLQRVLGSIMRASLRPSSLKEVLEYALGAIISAPFFSMMNMGAIFLAEDDGLLTLAAQRNLPDALQEICASVPFGECLCGRAADTRKPVYVDKVDTKHSYRYTGIEPHGHYCVPILLGDRVLGVFNTYLPDGHAESREELEFLDMIADTLAGIIERKRAEEGLRLHSEMISNMTEGAALIRTDNAVIVHANLRFEEMFGYGPGELVGKNVGVLNAPSSDGLRPDEIRNEIVDALTLDGQWSGEVANVRKDGTTFWSRATVSTFTSEQHGEVWLAVHEDITAGKAAEEERERLEGQLVQSQKMEAIGTLAGGVAHDFNNIMTVIKNLTTLALGKIGDDTKLREYLEPVCEVSERAADLVQQLLVFSQSKPLVSEPVDINDTVEGLLVMLKSLVREDIELDTRLADGLMEVEGDRSRIEQVLTNLIVNSRDAMPKGGSIAIVTENVHFGEKSKELGEGAAPGEYVRLVVRDTGTGMPPEVAEHIFEPFFTTKSPEGTGLGLSVVYGIVREAGGWIEVDTKPGAGTRIAVYFPAVVGADAAACEYSPARKVNHGDGRRVLLVEDDKWVRRSTAMVLAENGYNVTEAENAEDAIRLFYREKGRFDLILSDVVMPGRSGLQMLSPILDLNPSMPVLLFSGHLDDKVELAEIIRRGIAYIQKPFEIPDLLCAVEDTIEAGREER